MVFVVLMLGDFVLRGIIPSFAFDKNDFSDPFCASWLWSHGQNPYDSVLATNVNRLLVHSQIRMVPVYPPTTYLLLSPLSLLPWKWANLLWALSGVTAVIVSAYALLQIAGTTLKHADGWLLSAFVLGFSPFHTGVHVANVAAIATALCLLCVHLANRGRNLQAGLLLASASCLKPQLGIWFLIFYIARRRWSLVIPAAVFGLVVLFAAVIRIPVAPPSLLHSYAANLRYWFDPGGANDFTAANPFRFGLVNTQVILFPLLGVTFLTNLSAWVLFVIGFAVWGHTMLRSRCIPDPLALCTLLALALIPFYHRSYDTAFLPLALCWMLAGISPRLKLASRVILLLLVILAVPGQSVVIRLNNSLPSDVTSTWWWQGGIAAYAPWTVLFFAVTLLCTMRLCIRTESKDPLSDVKGDIREDLRVDQPHPASTDSRAHALTPGL